MPWYTSQKLSLAALAATCTITAPACAEPPTVPGICPGEPIDVISAWLSRPRPCPRADKPPSGDSWRPPTLALEFEQLARRFELGAWRDGAKRPMGPLAGR